jgi:hypothetical protein
LVIARRVAVEKMMRSEIEAATREIMEYLDAHGDMPVLAIKDALGRRELYFYMGLGELILRSRVLIQESDGVLWARHTVPQAKAA